MEMAYLSFTFTSLKEVSFVQEEINNNSVAENNKFLIIPVVLSIAKYLKIFVKKKYVFKQSGALVSLTDPVFLILNQAGGCVIFRNSAFRASTVCRHNAFIVRTFCSICGL